MGTLGPGWPLTVYVIRHHTARYSIAGNLVVAVNDKQSWHQAPVVLM